MHFCASISPLFRNPPGAWLSAGSSRASCPSLGTTSRYKERVRWHGTCPIDKKKTSHSSRRNTKQTAWWQIFVVPQKKEEAEQGLAEQQDKPTVSKTAQFSFSANALVS